MTTNVSKAGVLAVVAAGFPSMSLYLSLSLDLGLVVLCHRTRKHTYDIWRLTIKSSKAPKHASIWHKVWKEKGSSEEIVDASGFPR